MPAYDFRCQRCLTTFEERHSMSSIPDVVECLACGGRAERQFAAPNFSTRGDDLLDNGKPQYVPAVARKMPYGKEDPQAYFTSKTKAREAARKKADTGDYTLTLD